MIETVLAVARVLVTIGGGLLLILGENLHSWLVGLAVLVLSASWTLVATQREQIVLLTAIAERE